MGQRDSVLVLLQVGVIARMRVCELARFFLCFTDMYMTLSGHLNMHMYHVNFISIKINQPLLRKLHPSLKSKSLRAE